jgi:hypothetical protein
MITDLIEKVLGIKLEEKSKLKKFGVQGNTIKEITKVGGFADYCSYSANVVKEAFCPDDHGSECELFHVAGSAILLPEDELREFIDKVKAMNGCCVCCMDERIKAPKHAPREGLAISWHKGCGAVKLYCKKNNIPVEHVDREAKAWAEKLAARISQETGRKVGVMEMKIENPKFHYARACYYDRTGKFNNKRAKNLPLPEGFIVGRDHMSETSALGEVGVAIDIMFGEHGLGKLLTHEDPFILVAVGQTQEEVVSSMKELEKIRDEKTAANPDLANRIVVQGFVRPA